MSEVKMSGSLPKGDASGLGPIVQTLLRDPHRFHAVMAIVDCKKADVNFDSGETVPVLRIRRIEVVLPEDLDAAQRLIRRSLERRSGETVLPLDLEEDLRKAFEDVDPETGERIDRSGGQQGQLDDQQGELGEPGGGGD